MKKQLLVTGTLCFILLLGTLIWSSCTTKKETTATAPSTEVTEQPKVPSFIAAIQEKVKGKEDLPAEEVFKNIEILKGMPAGRVLPIMQMAFNKGLGVKCNHCHVFGDWANESPKAKQITRDMWVMTGKINRETLSEVPNLTSGEKSAINCITCHRGEVKPALTME